MNERQLLETLWNEVANIKTRLAVAESNIKELKEDINSIKGNTTWILRLLVGGMIGAILTFMISGGFNV